MINDNDERDFICPNKNFKNTTIISLDNLEENFGFSSNNIANPKEMFLSISTMSNNITNNVINNCNGNYVDYVPIFKNKSNEKENCDRRKKDEKKKVKKEEKDEYDLDFDFNNYKNDLTSLEKF